MGGVLAALITVKILADTTKYYDYHTMDCAVNRKLELG